MATSRTLAKAEKTAEKASIRLARLKEENKNAVATATRTVVTIGGSFGIAYFLGRYPERTEILGVNAALGVGAALSIASMMGWAGKQDKVVEALGTGALSAYGTTKGYELGMKAKAESQNA
ncbi:MAG TPA: hypothetical protein VM487_12920 [Phycisphaerae bacterium]|nr:hypothetical protein [Phycisphaerae bacterium]